MQVARHGLGPHERREELPKADPCRLFYLQRLALGTGSHFLSQNMMHTCVVRYNDTDEMGIRVRKG
jgi:hypothetical protein